MSLFGRDPANRGDWIDLFLNRIAGLCVGILVGLDFAHGFSGHGEARMMWLLLGFAILIYAGHRANRSLWRSNL
jgi:uncharacterized membrane protein YccC